MKRIENLLLLKRVENVSSIDAYLSVLQMAFLFSNE